MVFTYQSCEKPSTSPGSIVTIYAQQRRNLRTREETHYTRKIFRGYLVREIQQGKEYGNIFLFMMDANKDIIKGKLIRGITQFVMT